MPRQRGLTLEHPVQGERQPHRIDVFEEVAGGASAERVEEVRVRTRDREHHHCRVREIPGNRLGGMDAVAGHVDVE